MTGIPPLSIGRAQARKPSVKLPKALSKGEETFALQMKARGIDFLRELTFDVRRKWRLDFAFPRYTLAGGAPLFRLAVEIDGGSFSGGRHTRGKGFEADLQKLNAAAIAGWLVLRYSTSMVMSGLADSQVAKMLGFP